MNLQTCIQDTEDSLQAITEGVDKLLESNDLMGLIRQASERETLILDRRTETRATVERANSLRDCISLRRKHLQAQRENLARVRALNTEYTSTFPPLATRVVEHRDSLATLRNHILSIRTSLVSALATIYPIDLYSSSDLLFTILNVPLPIPLNGTEPAPPLRLPSHKEVTEDAVATALGYAAHLVQLLAVYMGKGLIYPITYVGSKSLIKDNISAMVGPRMFPLFSKGVDTYRFEYGVFLLNKDIEMLMVERDLHVLDMRHTLPNLKNLLLTLIDEECCTRSQDASPSPSGLATPPHTPSPDSADVSPDTPKAGHVSFLACANQASEGIPPSHSSWRTPITGFADGTAVSRYSRLPLGFPPLSDFLRSRRSTSNLRSSTKSSSEQTERGQGSPCSPENTLASLSDLEGSTKPLEALYVNLGGSLVHTS